MRILLSALALMILVLPVFLSRMVHDSLSYSNLSNVKNSRSSGRSIASVPAIMPETKTESDGGSAQSSEQVVTQIRDIQSHYNQSIILAATAEELNSLKEVELVIQGRANKLCAEMGVKNHKPYHKCQSYTLAEVEDNSESAVLPLISNNQLRVNKSKARARRLKPQTKALYCQSPFAIEHEQIFCNAGQMDSDAFTLKPKRFAEITCVLRDQPFPIERRRVLAQPTSHAPHKFNSNQNSTAQ